MRWDGGSCRAGDTPPRDWLTLSRKVPGRVAGRIHISCGSCASSSFPLIPVIATVFNPLFQASAAGGMETFRLHAHERPTCYLTGSECSRPTLQPDRVLPRRRSGRIFLASHMRPRRGGLEMYLKWLGRRTPPALTQPWNALLLPFAWRRHLCESLANGLPLMLHYDAARETRRPDLLLADRRMGVATA